MSGLKMKTIFYYAGIIRLIRKVHLKISLIVLHKHVLNYRKEVHHVTGLGEEIRSSIEYLIQDAILNVNGQSIKNDSTDYELLANRNNRSTYVQTLNRKELGELAKYFKERNNKSIFNSLEEKLEKSTIDHMHEAIRYARQGDERNAHMHADIASSSCEELSHFMSKEQHHEFVGQIKGGLEVLRR
jgi:hypothetical protein